MLSSLDGVEFLPPTQSFFESIHYQTSIPSQLIYTYDPNVVTLKNVPLENKNVLNYIPLDRWIVNTPLTSYDSLVYYSDYLWNIPNLYCRGRDIISEIKINNTNFLKIDLKFPDTNVFPIVDAYGYSGVPFDFMGTNALTISGNDNLSSVDLDLRTFRGASARTYLTRPIKIENNPKLSCVNISLKKRSDEYVGYYAYTDDVIINIINNNINSFSLTSHILPLGTEKDQTNYYDPSYYVFFKLNTSYSDSVKLKTLALTSKNYNNSFHYLTLSSITNPLYTNYDLMSASNSSYSEYLDYSSWNVLKGNLAVTPSTLSSYKPICINGGIGDAIIKQQWYQSNLNFVDASSATLMKILSSGNGARLGPCYFPSESIPSELYFNYVNSNNVDNMPAIKMVATNPNTLFYYQSKLVSDALSGKIQPWTFYRPISASGKVNANFKYNNGPTFKWPLSSLNNISRMAYYQGPFADGPMPYTLIHPRYAITAEHWAYGKTYPYNISFLDTNTGNTTAVTVVSSAAIPGSDIRVVKFQTPLLSSSFPGMYVLPLSLYIANSATKIQPYMPALFFSQDYDITPTQIKIPNSSTSFSRIMPSYDTTSYLSTKALRVGDSGHPEFTFINNKPILIGTHTSTNGGDSITKYYDKLQTLLNTLEQGTVNLNVITQQDLNVYSDMTVY